MSSCRGSAAAALGRRGAAPCTKVKEFYGRFLDAVAARSMNVTFSFVFPFAHGTRYVDVSIYYKTVDDTVWVIVRRG